MKQLFTVGVKLLGVYFIFSSLFTLFSSIAPLIAYFDRDILDPWVHLAVLFVASAAQLTFGTLALLKTEFFTAIAKLPDTPIPMLDTQGSFRVGIVLIGVFMLVNTFGLFLTNFVGWFFRDALDVNISPPTLWANFFRTLFALALIVFSRQATERFARQRLSVEDNEV